MIRQILASAATLAVLWGTALAADLPTVKGPPVFTPPPPVFSWTGLYVGGQVGYQWGTTTQSIVAEPGDIFVHDDPTFNDQGVVGGAHLGYDWQVNQIVLGLEGDVEGSSYSGGASITESAVASTFAFNTRIPLEGSLRGRIGWAWDRVLFYGTGGAAFASISHSLGNVTLSRFDQVTTGRAGWTAGGGVEYAIDPHWSVRVEYRYTDYGPYNLVLLANSAPPGSLAQRMHETDNRVEAGFSYKFDFMPPPVPVVAKY